MPISFSESETVKCPQMISRTIRNPTHSQLHNSLFWFLRSYLQLKCLNVGQWHSCMRRFSSPPKWNNIEFHPMFWADATTLGSWQQVNEKPCGYLGLVGIECKFGDPFCCHWGLRKSIQALLTLLWGSGQGLAVTRLVTGSEWNRSRYGEKRKLCFAYSIPCMCFAYSKWDLSRPYLHALHTWMTPVNLPTRGRGRKRTPLGDNDLSLSNNL